MAFKKAEEISKNFANLTIDQTMRGELLQRHFHMYGHSTLSSNSMPFWFTDGKIKFNIVQSCVDTLLNKITKNSPRARFMTDFGVWENRKKAQKREQFVFGEFYKSKVYEKTKQAMHQCLIFGDGWVKVWSRDKKIKVASKMATQIYVNENGTLGEDGKPREIWEVAFYEKDTLKNLYPSKRDALEKADIVDIPFYISAPEYSRLVQVIEYFRSPLGADKGEHRIITGGVDLIAPETWERPLPYAHIGFIPNAIGFYNKGVAEVLTGFQVEINKTLKRMSDSIRLVSSPKVLYDMNSKINKAHFNNDVGAMIGYLGNAPTFINPSAISPEIFNWLQYMVQRSYEEVGISQLSAGSMKPAGLNSGKALREYSDIETERFAALVKSWENLHLQISELVLEEAKSIAEKHGNYSVLAPDTKGCSVIDFKSIDLDKDSYYIQCYPTSMLPKTPSGRLEYVQEMAASQLITPEEALSLLDFPDTEKITKLKTSPMEDALATVDHMLDTGEYLPPEPYQKLDLCLTYMQSAYLHYKNEGCPEEKLALIIRWIDDANMLIQSIIQEQTESASLEEVGPMTDEEEQAIMDEGISGEEVLPEGAMIPEEEIPEEVIQ